MTTQITNSDAVNIGSAVNTNSIEYAQRVFAVGWFSSALHYQVDIDEDGEWIEWDENFDLHFYCESGSYTCVRYEVKDKQTQRGSGKVLFSSTMTK